MVISIDYIQINLVFKEEIIISYAISLRKNNATLEVNILGQYKTLNLMNYRK